MNFFRNSAPPYQPRLSAWVLAAILYFMASPIFAQVPVVTSSLNASGKVGAAFTYRIKATNKPSQFTATGLPKGLKLNAKTGLISGTPTKSGTFNINISVKNTKGNSKIVVLTFKITKTSATQKVTVSTLAGSGNSGFADGNGTPVRFYRPNGVAVDGSGNIYVADTDNHRIRKIGPNRKVTTLAGSDFAGFADGQGTSARFNGPKGVAVDGNGNVYVADSSNNCIRKITPGGLVSTLAGSDSKGFADGSGNSASFNYPTGVAVDKSGNVYVADKENHRIRKITPGGTVKTLAGGAKYYKFADGNGTSASFYKPTGVAVDSRGNIYVADSRNNRIRKITPGGKVITLAGSDVYNPFTDGNGTSASFYHPTGVAVDGSGNVYVADHNNHRIRKISPNGAVTTLAGSALPGYADGDGKTAKFIFPSGIALDGSGNVYVADSENNRIRKITISQ